MGQTTVDESPYCVYYHYSTFTDRLMHHSPTFQRKWVKLCQWYYVFLPNILQPRKFFFCSVTPFFGSFFKRLSARA